jgi:two-component system nitrate/nitrite response regulator NarL
MKSVARRLGVTPHTAKSYIDRVREKYNDVGREARTKIELRIRAVEDGFLSEDR